MSRLGAYARPTSHLPAPTPQETMQWMGRLIRQGQYDQRIRELVEREVIPQVFPHDYLSEYVACLNWVRANVRYTRDPRSIEQLKTPAVVLETRSADCDDMAILLGAMVGQIGAGVRLCAGGFKGAPLSGDGGPILSHVWLEAYDPSSKSWVVLDPVPGRKVHQMLGKLARVERLEVLS